ncbi:HAD family hydrolase [Krasilnikovia sp. MM14-A1259]|uniref:HAD family hydrolase n=1 Tax=Krasilnikovia sp. MM14-A1259 TaxID=3373539 RepID=UPI00382EEB1F
MTAVRAVWTDFGGVLTPPVAQTLERFCADARVPVEEFQRAMRAVAQDCGVADPMAPLDTPLLDQRAWEVRMERELAGAGVPADLSDFPQRWFADRAINDTWVATLRRLRAAGVFVGLLSNMPPAWDRYWRDMVAPELFADLVLSFEVGVRKPEPAIFAVAGDRAAVPPQQCVLVDDLPANCAAARSAGWQAVCFSDTTTVNAALAELLGDPAVAR